MSGGLGKGQLPTFCGVRGLLRETHLVARPESQTELERTLYLPVLAELVPDGVA